MGADVEREIAALIRINSNYNIDAERSVVRPERTAQAIIPIVERERAEARREALEAFLVELEKVCDIYQMGGMALDAWASVAQLREMIHKARETKP